MDRRGRLAQSLTFPRFPRLRRLARRWLSPLFELNPPHGYGTTAVVILVAGSVAYGVVKGQHGPDLTAELKRACDRVANTAGLRISSIALAGQKQLTRADVLHVVGLGGESSLLCLDVAAARDALKDNPWVAEATVRKLYPGRLQIDLVERKPLALWQKDGAVRVIATDGAVLENFDGFRFAGLPLVVGAGAARAAQDFLAVVARYPVLREAVEASVLVAQRRWNLRLKNGIDVRLPDADIERALQTLVALDRDKKLLSRDIAAIDLRLADRVTIRLSDDAAAARAEAVKDLGKKVKRKGHDA